MTGRGTQWRRIQEDGTEWEVRIVPGSEGAGGTNGDEEMVEFFCVEGTRKPRRVAVRIGSVREMDEAALSRAYRQARPIGGDHYGRPGTPANDAG